MTLPPVTVFGYGPAWGYPDLSPFVTKVLYYLKAQKFPFRSVVASPRDAPRGKLPFIEVNRQQFSDSQTILRHLESIHPEPMDRWITVEHRAVARPLQSMLEEHLYFITLCGRWQHEQGFRVLKPVLLNYLQRVGVPTVLSPLAAGLIRGAMIRQVKAQGAGRSTPSEHRDCASEIFSALDKTLGDQLFMLGDRPCTLDCTVGAFTTLGLIEAFDHGVAQAFREYPRLMAYARRSHGEFLAR